MKIGMRKPSLKKSFKARTTGKIMRKAKKAINPLYGKKGMGFIKNPKKSVKNAMYHRTTVGVGDITRAVAPATKPQSSSKKRGLKTKNKVSSSPTAYYNGQPVSSASSNGILWAIFGRLCAAVLIILSAISLIITPKGFFHCYGSCYMGCFRQIY